MTLNEKLEKYVDLTAELERLSQPLREQIAALESDIKDEVMQLEQTVDTGRVRATYGKGRGSYDYEALAMLLEPDGDVIAAHSTTRVDWRKVCEATGCDDEMKARVYSPGTPYVSIKIKQEATK